jgi:hypothetical protein
VAFPLDLHVLSTPPAFVLSQDQTLHRKTSPNPTTKAAEAEGTSIRATSPDRTKLTHVRIIVQRNRDTNTHHPTPKGQDSKQTLTSTGQNKLIRRLIKHTVEFSKIRRTHIAIR